MISAPYDVPKFRGTKPRIDEIPKSQKITDFRPLYFDYGILAFQDLSLKTLVFGMLATAKIDLVCVTSLAF